MAESLANALALHISRQAESIINDRIYNYSHKALVTLLQLDDPQLLERWRVGGAMPKCHSEHAGRNNAIGRQRDRRARCPPGYRPGKYLEIQVTEPGMKDSAVGSVNHRQAARTDPPVLNSPMIKGSIHVPPRLSISSTGQR